jgi:hypothetical protein
MNTNLLCIRIIDIQEPHLISCPYFFGSDKVTFFDPNNISNSFPEISASYIFDSKNIGRYRFSRPTGKNTFKFPEQLSKQSQKPASPLGMIQKVNSIWEGDIIEIVKPKPTRHNISRMYLVYYDQAYLSFRFYPIEQISENGNFIKFPKGETWYWLCKIADEIKIHGNVYTAKGDISKLISIVENNGVFQ